jgi:hypothetical protein
MTEGLSRRRQWLVVGAATVAGSIQAYRVAIGDGGTLGLVAALGWLVVLLVSGWQLHRTP